MDVYCSNCHVYNRDYSVACSHQEEELPFVEEVMLFMLCASCGQVIKQYPIKTSLRFLFQHLVNEWEFVEWPCISKTFVIPNSKTLTIGADDALVISSGSTKSYDHEEYKAYVKTIFEKSSYLNDMIKEMEKSLIDLNRKSGL